MKLRDFLLGDFFKKRHQVLVSFLIGPYFRLRRFFFPRKKILFVGQSYYHAWNSSRALRTRGWQADVLNWDMHESSQIYYHGEDVRFFSGEPEDVLEQFDFYVKSIFEYDIFQFSNIGGMVYGYPLHAFFAREFGLNFEIQLLKRLGKTIVYTHTGCLDGVSQTSFSKWGPESVCRSCVWRERPDVCSDEKNLTWGKYRNEMADYQFTLGGNRVDYNASPTVHEEPEFFCLDAEAMRPDLEIPEQFRLDFPAASVKLYHAVGNASTRTNEEGVNIKSTHIYLPLIDRLRAEGHSLELISVSGVANKDVKYYQAQADIVLEMLTYGFFGANGREALMLGKPLVCYLRPEWLESMRREIPEYVDELPVVNATPDTVYEVVKQLIENKQQRDEIGRKSREFAVKWHSTGAAAERLDRVYSSLLYRRKMEILRSQRH
ncbi:glycosyltransferase [Achromobacter xylosoxidans]|uniref:glycosyltransferase n=1 Tax=Alcaligenes xylosoxydans xylosoxydans TaxID=85698 RepID=UPI001F241E5F|nr:glycosyltransferase [Achromobacter xylosoxidans]